MATKSTEKPDTVTRCVPRQDGAFLIITRKGLSGRSDSEIREGAHVIIREGVVRSTGQ